MSLIDDLIAIGSVSVGDSDEYAVVGHIQMTDEIIAPDDLNVVPVLRQVWKFKCVAKAAAANLIAQLGESLAQDLVQRGAAVSLTQLGGDPRVMPASGGNSGSMAGYPRTSINLLDEESVGTWQTFELMCETMIPQPQSAVSGYNLVLHSKETEYTRDNDSNLTVRVSGDVRVRNNQNAKTYIETQILTPAKTAASTAGHTFVSSIRQRNDSAVASYQYTEAPQGSNPGSGIEQAEVTDVTTSESGGRIVRVVSGSAKGANAATFAVAQEPTPGSGERLTQREVSQPSIPEGRVTFRYEVLTGIVDTNFPGLRIYGFSETITETAGGRRIETANFKSRDPMLWKGERRPWVYTQRTRIEFLGDWDNAEITPRMDEDNLLEIPTPSDSTSANGLRVREVVHVFVYATQQTKPDPYEIPAL